MCRSWNILGLHINLFQFLRLLIGFSKRPLILLSLQWGPCDYCLLFNVLLPAHVKNLKKRVEPNRSTIERMIHLKRYSWSEISFCSHSNTLSLFIPLSRAISIGLCVVNVRKIWNLYFWWRRNQTYRSSSLASTCFRHIKRPHHALSHYC